MVFGTDKSLQTIKFKLYLANRGYDLMDKKYNVLFRELVSIKNTTKLIKNQLAISLSSSKKLINRAKIEINHVRLAEISRKIAVDMSITIIFRYIMGVQIPIVYEPAGQKPPYSLYEGSIALDESFLAWRQIKQLLLKLAEAQTATKRIESAMKKAYKRAAALENIVIPICKAQIKYISEQQEEQARDEIARVKLAKKIQSVIM